MQRPHAQAKMLRWRHLLLKAGGVNFKQVVTRERLEPTPTLLLSFDQEACHGDADPSGLGGVMNSFYYYYAVPIADYDVVHAPILEFLAVCFSILQAGDMIDRLGLGEQLAAGQITVVLRTDALTTALTLPAETRRNEVLQLAFHRITNTRSWARLSANLAIIHIFGDHQYLSDPLPVSRARWGEFAVRCSSLGLTLTQLPASPEGVEIYQECVQLLQYTIARNEMSQKAVVLCRSLSVRTDAERTRPRTKVL